MVFCCNHGWGRYHWTEIEKNGGVVFKGGETFLVCLKVCQKYCSKAEYSEILSEID